MGTTCISINLTCQYHHKFGRKLNLKQYNSAGEEFQKILNKNVMSVFLFYILFVFWTMIFTVHVTMKKWVFFFFLISNNKEVRFWIICGSFGVLFTSPFACFL